MTNGETWMTQDVDKATDKAAEGVRVIPLSQLPPGGTGRIVRIQGQSPFKKRLLEMGLVKGETIFKIKLAPLADPAEYIVKDYHLSLRRQEAQDVWVEVLE